MRPLIDSFFRLEILASMELERPLPGMTVPGHLILVVLAVSILPETAAARTDRMRRRPLMPVSLAVDALDQLAHDASRIKRLSGLS